MFEHDIRSFRHSSFLMISMVSTERGESTFLVGCCSSVRKGNLEIGLRSFGHLADRRTGRWPYDEHRPTLWQLLIYCGTYWHCGTTGFSCNRSGYLRSNDSIVSAWKSRRKVFISFRSPEQRQTASPNHDLACIGSFQIDVWPIVPYTLKEGDEPSQA